MPARRPPIALCRPFNVVAMARGAHKGAPSALCCTEVAYYCIISHFVCPLQSSVHICQTVVALMAQ